MLPVRCFTCNAVIEHLWETYSDETSNGKTRKSTLDDLNITRMCCRRMFLAHVSTIDDIMHYSNSNEELDTSKTKFFCKPSPAFKISCD